MKFFQKILFKWPCRILIVRTLCICLWNGIDFLIFNSKGFKPSSFAMYFLAKAFNIYNSLWCREGQDEGRNISPQNTPYVSLLESWHWIVRLVWIMHHFCSYSILPRENGTLSRTKHKIVLSTYSLDGSTIQCAELSKNHSICIKNLDICSQ